MVLTRAITMAPDERPDPDHTTDAPPRKGARTEWKQHPCVRKTRTQPTRVRRWILVNREIGEARPR